MAQKNDGGSAFPRSMGNDALPPGVNALGTNFDFGATGMSLRDYFAAQAMEGLLSAEGVDNFYPHTEKGTRFQLLARDAVSHADALLEALGETS